MVEICTSEALQRWLLESGHLGKLWDRPRFVFDTEEFERELAGVREQYPQFRDEEAEARAALRLLGKQEARARLVVVSGRRQWTRRERLLVTALLAAAAALLLSLLARPIRAQALQATDRNVRPTYRSLLLAPDAEPQQPTGVVWYWQQSGSALHTFAGGVGYVNCATNITCSYAGNPPTITITGSGGSSGCIPPGTTANALLFDAGSSACNDTTKLTWNSGTSTVSLLSGGIFDPTAGTVKVPGLNGQLLYNNSGNLGAEDPIVSGPDATGVAPTKNPVQTGALDNSTGCSSGPCVRSFITANGAPAGTEYGLITRNIPSGTQAVSGTFWQATQPVSGTFWQSTQPVSCANASTCPVNASQVGGPWTQNLTQVAGTALGSTAVTNFGAAPAAAAVPGVNASLYIGTAAPDTNTGNASGQTQRVAVATNNPAIANWGQGATGSGVPSGAIYDGGDGSGNLTGRLQCDGYAFYDASTNGATQLVALVSGKTIYVCGYSFSSSSSTANTLKLVYGTGSNCATGQTAMTPGIVLQAAASTGPIGKVIPPTGHVSGLKTAASNALCVLTNAAQAAQAEVWYTQF